jgi:FlaA1/EpsC-like NDP-sugar epimerase
MRRFVLVIAETVLLFAAGLTATHIRFGFETSDVLFNQRGWMKLAMLTVVLQLAFYLFDLYDLPATRRYRRVIINLVIALSVSTVVLSIVFYVVPALQMGRGVFLVDVTLIVAIIPAWRLVVAWSAGHPEFGVRERVLILGSGHQAIELARATLERQASGFYIVGFVDNKPELVGKSLINPKVIGLTKDIGMLVDQHQIDRIVVAVADRRGVFPTEELLGLSLSGRVAVEESARYYERLTGRIDSEMLRPSWLIFSRGNRFSDLEYHVRRVVNVGLAAVGLVLSLPIMLLTALAVKLESRGPILYVQERV